jgi:hypothetical protein
MSMSSRTLSEVESKRVLGSFGIPFAQEREVRTAAQAAEAAVALSFPVAIKLCGEVSFASVFERRSMPRALLESCSTPLSQKMAM